MYLKLVERSYVIAQNRLDLQSPPDDVDHCFGAVIVFNYVVYQICKNTIILHTL